MNVSLFFFHRRISALQNVSKIEHGHYAERQVRYIFNASRILFEILWINKLRVSKFPISLFSGEITY